MWRGKLLLSCSTHVQLFATPWTAGRQNSLSFPISQNLLKLTSTELMMPSNHLVLCHPIFSYLQSFPASSSLPTSQLFASVGQSIGASASAPVLPINIQGWFLLGLIDLISLLSRHLSRVLSSTTVWKPQFFSTQVSYGSVFTTIYDYWKNHSFDYMDLCQQSDVSSF